MSKAYDYAKRMAIFHQEQAAEYHQLYLCRMMDAKAARTGEGYARNCMSAIRCQDKAALHHHLSYAYYAQMEVLKH